MQSGSYGVRSRVLCWTSHLECHGRSDTKCQAMQSSVQPPPHNSCSQWAGVVRCDLPPSPQDTRKLGACVGEACGCLDRPTVHSLNTLCKVCPPQETATEALASYALVSRSNRQC